MAVESVVEFGTRDKSQLGIELPVLTSSPLTCTLKACNCVLKHSFSFGILNYLVSNPITIQPGRAV